MPHVAADPSPKTRELVVGSCAMHQGHDADAAIQHPAANIAFHRRSAASSSPLMSTTKKSRSGVLERHLLGGKTLVKWPLALPTAMFGYQSPGARRQGSRHARSASYR
jgi:hypothetical protein